MYKTMNPILSVNDLSISFHQGEVESHVVKKVSFDLQECETLALVGESGSGKSLTAHSIMRLLPYPMAFHPSGSVEFNNKDLLKISPKSMGSIRGNQIGMIFQEPISALNPLHTIEKQIAEVLKIHRGLNPRQAQEETLKLLHKVRIREPETKLKAYPHQLSGGQRQRVMIAMALANSPKLLIADEPTTALDVTVQKDILDLLVELKNEKQMSVLLITHDLGVVRYIADRVLVMKNGEIIEHGETQTLLNTPKEDYTKLLINSHPSSLPLDLPAPLDELSTVMSAQSLCVTFPRSKPLFGKCKNFFDALKNIDLTIQTGSTLGIVGESGSGKSTLAFAMLRLLSSKGGIFLDGQAIHKLKEKALRPLRSNMQVVFQDPFSSLSPRMCIRDIISEGLELHHNFNRSEIDHKVDQIMREVDLDPIMKHRYPHEFSGGQRQRIAIARALILNPRVIFLDEPTSALDRAVQLQVLDLLKRLQQDRKLTYVFISHDMHVIRAISHKVIVLKDGEIVEQGLAEKVLQQPQHSYTQKLLSATLI